MSPFSDTKIAALLARFKAGERLATLLLVALIAFIGWAFLNNISLKGINVWALLAMAALGLLSIGVAMAVDKDLPKSPREWLQPAIFVRLIMALLFGLGLIISVYQVLAPSAAVESRPGLMEDTLSSVSSEQLIQGEMVRDIKAAVAPDVAPVRDRISGVWGEEGCAVTFRFVLKGDVLTVDSVRRPAGTQPYSAVASVLKAEGNTLTTIDRTSGGNKGKASTLTLSAAGDVPALHWNNESEATGETLVKCD